MHFFSSRNSYVIGNAGIIYDESSQGGSEDGKGSAVECSVVSD
jgi:hypothetical protein